MQISFGIFEVEVGLVYNFSLPSVVFANGEYGSNDLQSIAFQRNPSFDDETKTVVSFSQLSRY